MKHFLHILLLFLFQTTFAQHTEKLPSIPFNTYKAEVSEYYKLLGIRDKTALIITAGELPDYSDAGFKYAVYYKNGSIRMFTENDNVIQEVTASDRQQQDLKDFLFDTNWADIVNDNLSGQHEEDKFLITLDCTINYFQIIRGNKELSLNSLHTLSNIDRKVPGWEDRIEFLDLIAKFESYF